MTTFEDTVDCKPMANTLKIEVGDVVKLSTHPTKFMTVNSIDGEYIESVWAGARGESVFRNFNVHELELVSKKAAGKT